MSNVKATSAAVTGTPSCHFARGSRWNVSVTLSVQSHRAASCGTKSPSPTVLADIPTSATPPDHDGYVSHDRPRWERTGEQQSNRHTPPSHPPPPPEPNQQPSISFH